MSGFKVVSDRPTEPVGGQELLQAEQAKQQAARWLVTSLQAVSQRFTTAVALAWHTTFTAGLAASAWWLWAGVLAVPDAPKLVGASIYSLFCLAVIWLRK